MFNEKFVYTIARLIGIGTDKVKIILVLLIYFAIVNVVAYIAMSIDKKRACKGKSRIPENFLISLAIIGGGTGTVTAMKRKRHKTKKRSFTVGMPILVVANYVFLLVLILYFYFF